MATNSILPFAPTDTGTNLMPQAEYAGSTSRLVGNQPGIASLQLVNKALRGPSLVAAALAQLVASNQAADVNDTLTVGTLTEMMRQAIAAVASSSGEDRVGSFLMVADTVAPLGTVKANGANLSRTTYARLFAKWGTRFGVGDGSTTFGIPNIRGDFVRALDDGAGIDVGRTLGSLQLSQNLAHTHTGSTTTAGSHQHNIQAGTEGTGPYAESNGTPTGGVIATDLAGDHAHTVTIDSGGGGAEVRVRNSAWLFCIVI